MKAKNCTGKKLQVGMIVCLESDKRNWLQKLFGVKRKIVEIANSANLKDIDTNSFTAGERLCLGEMGSMIKITTNNNTAIEKLEWRE